MNLAGKGGILKGSLQVLHVHVLLVAPLGAGHMAQPGTDQHEGRVTVRETAHHPGAAVDLPGEPLNDIVGADASPVFAGKIAVGKSLLNAILHFFSGLSQLHGAQFIHHSPVSYTHLDVYKRQVEGNRLHVDKAVDNLTRTAANGSCIVDDALRPVCKIDAHIGQAVFVIRLCSLISLFKSMSRDIANFFAYLYKFMIQYINASNVSEN